MKAILVDDNDSFIKQLPLELQESYYKKKTEIIKHAKKEFEKRAEENYKRRDKGLKEEKYHKEVLNSCIFPFVQGGLLPSNLDYEYLRSSPLAELKIKNVDFLIASQSKGIAIFGESKGSIDNPTLVISQYKKRMKVINDNISYVKQFVPNLKKIEYVLGVPSMDSNNVMKAILRSQLDIILWETGGIEEQQLSLVVPPNVDENIKKSVMHYDNDLNRALSKLTTSAEYKTFFHESHPVTKMALLSSLDKNDDNSFSYEQVLSIVSSELENTSKNELEKITQSILKLAIDINFVNCKTDGHYKIQSIHRNSKSRYEELKKKWIDYRHDLDRIFYTNKSLTKLQDEFNEKKKSIKSIDEYFPDKS